MRKAGPRIAIVSVLLLGLLIFGGVYYLWNTATDIFQPVDPAGSGKNISVEISSGETTAQIATDLASKHLIRNALAFRIWARVKGLDTHLEAGIYNKLNSSMTISDIITQLLTSTPDAVRVTIPEGYRLEQMAQHFANPTSGLPKFSAKTFLTYTQHIDQFPNAGKYPLLKDVPAGRSMEGLLFPSSYEIPVNATASDVIGIMLTAMQNNISTYHLDTLAQHHKMSVYQMLTLASIVEREAGSQNTPQERAGIASVYWNRVFKPNSETVGLLNADPTVQYARDTQNPPKTYWQPLNDSGSHIATNSPWNTYVNQGFPPTPICGAGLASLQAAAAPSNTNYYYFLTKKDGHAVFAQTLAEFQQDEQQYLQ